MSSHDPYLRLGTGFFLKSLEEPCAYNALSDELYALSPDAFAFLRLCDGTRTAADLRPEADFLTSCLEMGVLEALDEPRFREIAIGENEFPSLRYLMLEVTDRCNLRCRHCYLGEAGSRDLDLETALRALDDFGAMGGLRLMVTGGEPLLYPHFDLLNRSLADLPYRCVLITNGIALDGERIRRLRFREIQFSVDGLEGGHDYLRGKGTFRKVMRSLRLALQAGFDVSVATVIHSRNLSELAALGETLFEMDVSSWTLEFPVPSGRMGENRELLPSPEEAAPFFELEWGWGAHEGAEGYACGAHLACLEPGGNLVKCGYYRGIVGGAVAGAGLRRAWRELPKMRLRGSCADCELLAECGGGCRYRAELLAGEGGPDPVMCSRLGRAWR